MSNRINRRTFIKQTTLTATGLLVSGCTAVTPWFRRARRISPNERLNIAGVGVGGKGASDIKATSVGQNVVAICDVDEQRLDGAAKLYPNAKRYTDWRKLLDKTETELN